MPEDTPPPALPKVPFYRRVGAVVVPLVAQLGSRCSILNSRTFAFFARWLESIRICCSTLTRSKSEKGNWIILPAIIIGGVWIFALTKPLFTSPQPPAAVRPNLEKFIEAGSRLNSLTSQGVSNYSFGEQLATTAAPFDLLAPSWPSGYQPAAKGEFESALRGWKLLYHLWTRQINDDYHSTNNPLTITALEDYAPGRIVYDSESNSFIPYKANLRILMGIASEHFESGRALIQGK